MYCTNCGEAITEKTKFCPYCGVPVGGETEVSAFNDAAPQWETKFYTVRCVPPDYKNVKNVTAKFEAFGWELYSSQAVIDKDTDIEISSYEVRTTTKTDSSTELVFRRNKKMPHYKEIVELEEIYDNADSECEGYLTEPFGISLILGILGSMGGFGSLMTFTGSLSFMRPLAYPCFLVAVPCILYNVFKYRRNKKGLEIVRVNRAKYEPIKKECLEKVRNYIH